MTISTAAVIALRDLKCQTIDTVDERILSQKKVYLAQELGVPLGFEYSWYLHGPYSPALTTATYQIISEGFSVADGKKLKPQYQAVIDCVNLLEQETSRVRLNAVHWYELVAAVAYWYNKGMTDKAAIIRKINMCKPEFSSAQIEAACDSFMRLSSLPSCIVVSVHADENVCKLASTALK